MPMPNNAPKGLRLQEAIKGYAMPGDKP
jgi:hypothetical protein